MSTSQDRGRQFDYELARLIGGHRQPGSGNTVFAKLDAGVSGEIVVSGKHTDADSIRLTRGMVQEAASAVLGPEAPHFGVQSFIAIHFGPDIDDLEGAVAVVDLRQLLDWLRAPPEIIKPTAQDNLRATARTPPLFR